MVQEVGIGFPVQLPLLGSLCLGAKWREKWGKSLCLLLMLGILEWGVGSCCSSPLLVFRGKCYHLHILGKKIGLQPTLKRASNQSEGWCFTYLPSNTATSLVYSPPHMHTHSMSAHKELPLISNNSVYQFIFGHQAIWGEQRIQG